MIKILVSACLLGSPVRYDGKDKKSHHPVLQRWMDQGRLVSVCPEMLGGLGTPRPPSEIVNDGTRRVVTPAGADVTGAFAKGASASLEQAEAFAIRVAILKEGSPSCGSTLIGDGTFTKTKVAGEGITTAALRQRGIAVFSEEQLDEAEKYAAELEE